jgi:hypothetical protein
MHRPTKTSVSPTAALQREPHNPPATASIGQVESPCPHTSWFYPFTYKRFHVLLNSLFKVLCNFPSRYLFAIGLAVIFSLRWSLPPALGCTLKQPDSSIQQSAHKVWQRYGPSTRYGQVLVRGTCTARDQVRCTTGFTLHLLYATKTTGLSAELYPFRSPLLRVSLLVSFPPLNYMLKFSG